MKLSDMDFPEEVIAHPRQWAAQASVAELIARLRACETVQDRHEFQNDLLNLRLAVEADRAGFRRAAIRMKAGKRPQAGAATPQSGLDPAHPEAWLLEVEVCNRVIRQMRCIGDALAWRVFGFDRRHVIARCRNQSSGLMSGKEGLDAELQSVERAWRDDGEFAILHDLTNCLRIGDITVFGHDGPKTVEIKKNPLKSAGPQRRNISVAEKAVPNLGPLPGDNPGDRLYDLDIDFRTHMLLLATGMERAASEGIFAAKVPGGRALIVADAYGCSRQGWTDSHFGDRLHRKQLAAMRRAGIGPEPGYIVSFTSMDSVAFDPTRVPFAAYPLHPVACARLICDLAFFTVSTDGPVLADLLCEAGVDAEWIRPPSTAGLAEGEAVMELAAKAIVPVRGTVVAEISRTVQMRRNALDKYLIELIEHDTWIEGIRYLMTGQPLMPRQPWPCYRNEHQEWL